MAVAFLRLILFSPKDGGRAWNVEDQDLIHSWGIYFDAGSKRTFLGESQGGSSVMAATSLPKTLPVPWLI